MSTSRPAVALLVLWIIATTPGAAAQSSSSTATTPDSLTVALSGDRLTVRAQDRPLVEVLDRISRVAKIAIVRGPGLERDRVTIDLVDRAVDEALRHVVRGYDAFFFYGGSTPDAAGSGRLATVWVYPKGHGLAFEPGPPDVRLGINDLDKALVGDDPALRARAAELLVDLKGSQAVDSIVQALRDKDDDVRTRALRAAVVARLNLPPDLMATIAREDPYAAVRFEALQALAGDPSQKAVAQTVLNDPSPHVRHKAMEILGLLPEQQARYPRSERPPKRVRPPDNQ